ncbi:hypothetical protein ACWDYJ_14315 [Streptomyces sp. NPDC003042]
MSETEQERPPGTTAPAAGACDRWDGLAEGVVELRKRRPAAPGPLIPPLRIADGAYEDG